MDCGRLFDKLAMWLL